MDYISREKLMECIKLTASLPGGVHVSDILHLIDKAPAADVAPVRHGEWKPQGIKWKCSCCGVLMSIDGTPEENLLKFCPNCGARMGESGTQPQREDV